jgi:hypothetical protein
VSGDELDQFGADVRADMDAVEIGGDAGGCELSRMSCKARRGLSRIGSTKNMSAADDRSSEGTLQL